MPILMPSRDIGSSTPHTRESGSEPPRGPQFVLSVNQIPVKSGLPSGVRGAGAEGLNLPLAVRGIPAVGYFSHWANTVVHERVTASVMSTRSANGFHSRNISGLQGMTPFFHDGPRDTIVLTLLTIAALLIVLWAAQRRLMYFPVSGVPPLAAL